MAVSLLGSPEAVREAMRASEADFTAYRAGAKEPPSNEFQRLVDLIVVEQAKVVRANREILAELRRKS
jgi:hypothetical protein